MNFSRYSNNKKSKILFTLFLKDLKIHPYTNLFIFAFPTLFISIMYLVSITYFDSFETRDCIYLIGRMGIFMPLFYSESILEREHKKRTYILVRTLPISDETSYLSKNFFASFLIVISEIPGLVFLYLYFNYIPIHIYSLLLTCLFLFSTTLTLFLTLKFGLRLTFLITNIAAAIFIYLWRKFEDYYPVLAAQITANYLLYFLASALLLVGTYFFYRLGVRHFQKRDTRELVA